MSDAVKTDLIPSDGFKSRKFLFSSAAVGFIEIAATYGWLVAERMSSAEWSAMNMWLLPIALTIHSGANLLDSVIKKRTA